MTISLTLDYGSEDQSSLVLASNLGWCSLCDWVLSLPDAEVPDLACLCRHGSATGLDAAREQLLRALVIHPPDDPDLADVGRQVTETLDGIDPDSTGIIEM